MHAAPTRPLLLSMLALPVLAIAVSARAASPTVAQALSLKPIQQDVDYEVPSQEQQAHCTVRAESRPGVSGWVVRDPAGRYLRQFLDTNRDNKVDQWCYYKEGIEVYRDIDANFNGKADQYRWLGTEGIRWGLDPNEDGRIDQWKAISAEEVTAEVVAALRDRDAERFRRVLISAEEIDALGLGKEQADALKKKVAQAAEQFAQLARQQQVIGSDAKWIQFGGTRPGIVAAGTNGSTKDVMVYDNVTAVVQTGQKDAQVVVGTLIRVGEKWCAIDLPGNLLTEQANAVPAGFFFRVAMVRPVAEATGAAAGVSEALQKVMAEFEAVDRSLAAATSATQKAQLHAKRAELLEKIIEATEDRQERANWIRQYADTLSAAIQTGEYPAGIERLEQFYQQLAKSSDDSLSAAYVKYRYMNAQYTRSLQDPKADFAKIQQQWLQQLEQFTKDYPKAEDAADAMLQLALAQEFAGKETEARQWYGRIVRDFPTSELARKAVGAIRRLESVGKPLAFRGQTVDGKTVDLAQYRGNVVAIHYWATWCEPCKEEMKVLKDMLAKYGARGFQVIGVSLDSDRQQLASFLQSNRLPWPQLFEEGGLDSRLATELGILTLPAMILVDAQGRVLRRNIHAGELDAELSKQLR